MPWIDLVEEQISYLLGCNAVYSLQGSSKYVVRCVCVFYHSLSQSSKIHAFALSYVCSTPLLYPSYKPASRLLHSSSFHGNKIYKSVLASQYCRSHVPLFLNPWSVTVSGSRNMWDVRLTVLTAVVMEIAVFWSGTLLSDRRVPIFWKNVLHPSSG
jgi:hypothetical protein